MSKSFSNLKIMGVVYHILENKLPDTHETYKDVLISINPTNTKSKISETIKKKLIKFYKNPENTKSVLFLFMGPLINYNSNVPELRKILKNFSKHINSQKSVQSFSKLDRLKSLPSFGTTFLTKLNICDDTDNYLFSEVIFLEDYISKINSVDDIERIISKSITTNTKYKIEYNKILTYTDNFVDEDIMKSIKNKIILEFKNNIFTKQNLLLTLKKFNIPSITTNAIIDNIYGGSLLLENIPDFINNEIITYLLEIYLRFGSLSTVKFGKLSVNDFTINSYILSIFEKDSIYTDFNIESAIREIRLLGDFSDTNIIYLYNYNNISKFYVNSIKLNYCFPFNKIRQKSFNINQNIALLDIFSYSDTLKLNKIYLNNLENHNILSKKQHPLIHLFNTVPLSKDVPFSRFNDIQGGDEIFKIFKENIRMENDNYEPIINKRVLNNWCTDNVGKLDLNNINKLYRKLRKRKGETITDTPQTHDKKIILTFKVKLTSVAGAELIGHIYKFNTASDKRISIDIKPESGLKIKRTITDCWASTQKNLSHANKININSLSLNDLVKFKDQKNIYATIFIYNIGIDGKTVFKIQVDTSKLIKYDVLKSDYLDKINLFMTKYIYGDKYYTDKFVVSYIDLNNEIKSPIPYYRFNNYNINFHYQIKTNYPCIHEINRVSGIKIQDDIAWTSLIEIFTNFSPIIILDKTLKEYNINSRVFYYRKGTTPIPALKSTQNPNESWVEGTIVGVNDDNTYNIKLDTNTIINNVHFKYLKKSEKDHIILEFKKPYNHIKLLIDYHYLFDVKQTIDFLILGCSNEMILNYIKKILDLSFSIYNFINNKRYPSIDREPFKEVLLNRIVADLPNLSLTDLDTGKNDGGDDYDDDDDDDDDDDSSLDSVGSIAESSEEDEDDDDDEEDEEDDIYTDEVETDTGAVPSRIQIEKFENLFLDRLYTRDRELFAYDGYSDSCQASRVPKILSDEKKKEIDLLDAKGSGDHERLMSYGITDSDKNCNFESKRDNFQKDKLEINGKDLNDFITDGTDTLSELDKLKKYKKFIDGDTDQDLKAIKCKAIKYGSSRDKRFWYICPRIYDKVSSMPVDSRMLIYTLNSREHYFDPMEDNWRIDKNTKSDISDLNVRYKGPDGQIRSVWIAPKHRGTGQSYFYPGFLNYNSHPKSSRRLKNNKNPLFPVCCFQRYSNRFNQLVDLKRGTKPGEYIHEKSIIRNKYILIPNKECGVLPKELNRIFNQTKADVILSEKSKLNGVFIRVGLGSEDPYESNSFFSLMYNLLYQELDIDCKGDSSDVYETKTKNINKVKESIIKKFLTKNNSEVGSKVYFPSINNGFLENIFTKGASLSPYQNFLEYIISDDLKRYEFFYEIFTSKYNTKLPNKNSKSSIRGLILIIFEIVPNSEGKLEIKINCPFFSKNNPLKKDDFSHICMAIKYKDQYEPICYRKYTKIKKKPLTYETTNIFTKEDVFNNEGGETHLLYIKNIVKNFMTSCASINTLEYNFPGSTKITHSLLRKFIKSSKFRKQGKNPVKPSHYLIDSYNKVIGICFKWKQKVYKISILPEVVEQTERNKLEESMKSLFGSEFLPKTNEEISKEIEGRRKIMLPTLDEYEKFYEKITELSKICRIPIVIKIIKYLGLIKKIDYTLNPPMANLNLTGFATSFISNININNPNIDKTLLHLNCAAEHRLERLDKILFNYGEIDNAIYHKNKTKLKFDPEPPIDIQTLEELLSTSPEFKIKRMYIDNLKVVLLFTSSQLFIPIKPEDESYIRSTFQLTSDVDIVPLNIVPSDRVDIPDMPDFLTKVYHKSIKINKNNLINYCDELSKLSNLTGYKLPIFIKIFSTIPGQESFIFIESGVIVNGESMPQPLKININDFTITETIPKGNQYIINKIKKDNINFYTEREIISKKLGIYTNYDEDIKLVKFNYDRFIYQAILKKLYEFFSIETNKVIKKLKLFITNVVNNNVNNKNLHYNFRKRLLYPLLWKLLDIIIEPVIVSSTGYPVINIDDLSNLENNYPINWDSSTISNVDQSSIEKYIKESYSLINNDITTANEIEITDATLKTEEFKSNDLEKNLDYSKATNILYLLINKYNTKQYKKIEVLMETGGNRVNFLKYKICENLIANNFIQNQILKIYQNPYDSEERFKYDMKDEILFTKLEMENYSKLDELYSVIENKYYKENVYIEDKNKYKTHRFYYSGNGRRNPFIFNFNYKQ